MGQGILQALTVTLGTWNRSGRLVNVGNGCPIGYHWRGIYKELLSV